MCTSVHGARDLELCCCQPRCDRQMVVIYYYSRKLFAIFETCHQLHQESDRLLFSTTMPNVIPIS